MNKIYSDILSKVEMLTAGISKNAGELEKKSIRIDSSKLKTLASELEAASKKQEEAEELLRLAREKAHSLMDELKECYVDSKTPIKNEFLPDSWSKFGIQDKR